MALLNNIDKTKLLLVNGKVCDWAVANSAVLCNRQSLYTGRTLLCFPFCKAFFFFPLNLCFPAFHMSTICLCTCWRLKRSRRSGALLNVAGPRGSLFPLANMDLCAQDSVFSVSFSFSSLFTPPTSPLLYKANIEQSVYTKTTRSFTNECRLFPDAIFLTKISIRSITFWSLPWNVLLCPFFALTS